MKQKLILILFALFTSMGTWADVTVTISDKTDLNAITTKTLSEAATEHKYGTYSGSNSANPPLYTTFTTNDDSNLKNVIISSTTNIFKPTYYDGGEYKHSFAIYPASGSSTAQTITLTAPTGYYIKGYSMTFKSTGNAGHFTITPFNGSATTTVNPGVYAAQTITVSSLNANTATFTVARTDATKSAITELCLSNFTITLAAVPTYDANYTSSSILYSTGTFSRTDGNSSTNSNNTWESTGTSGLKFTSNYNSMGKETVSSVDYTCFHSGNSPTYTITAPDGFFVAGYAMSVFGQDSQYLQSNGYGKVALSTSSSSPTSIYVTDINARTVTMQRSGAANGWAYITSFTVYLIPTYTVTYNIKDGSSNLWASFNQEVIKGTEITDLPPLYKRAYCSYSLTSTTITNDTDIDVTCTYSGPTDLVFASDVADAITNNKWMELKRSNNTNYVYYNGSTLAYTATDLSTADGYQWAVIGNPYSYKLYNKGAQGYLSASVPTTNTSTTNDFTFNSTGLDFELFKYKGRAEDDHFVSVVKGTNTNEHTGTVLNEAGGTWKIWCGKDNSGFECYNGLMNGLSASLLLTFPVPTTFNVTYIVQDGGGNELDRAVAEVEAEDDGDAASAHMPASLVKSGCTYTYSPETVSEDAEITVTYTYDLECGFNVYEDYSDITTWYFLKRNDIDYIVYDSGSTPNIQRSTSLPDGDNASWAFVGNPYDGFKVYNKGAGSSVWMVSDTPSTSDEGAAATVSLASSGDVQSWFLSTSGYFTNGFFFANDDNYKLNGRHLQTTICYWTGGADGGSTFVTIENADYSSNVTSELASWFTTNVGDYFALSQETYDVQNSNYTAYSSSATYKQYMELKAAVEAGIKYPTAGYYRIKSKLTTDEYGYMGLNGEQLSGNLSNTNDASTIIYLTKSGDKYYFQTQGKYTSNVRKSNAVTLSDATPSEGFALTPYSPGLGIIRTYADGDYSYYHVAKDNSYKIVGWESSADASQWIFEDATTFSGTLNNAKDNTATERSYATLCVPFAISSLTGAEAYMPYISGSYVELGDAAEVSDGTLIPAGTPVILVGAKDAGTYTATIGTGYTTSPSEENALTGTFAGTTIDTSGSSTNYVLGLDRDKDNRIGFYHFDSTTYNLKANRAYLNTDSGETNVKGFVLMFDDDETGIVSPLGETKEGAAIYNLSGQRLNKMQKGINIINGKKVLF